MLGPSNLIMHHPGCLKRDEYIRFFSLWTRINKYTYKYGSIYVLFRRLLNNNLARVPETNLFVNLNGKKSCSRRMITISALYALEAYKTSINTRLRLRRARREMLVNEDKYSNLFLTLRYTLHGFRWHRVRNFRAWFLERWTVRSKCDLMLLTPDPRWLCIDCPWWGTSLGSKSPCGYCTPLRSSGGYQSDTESETLLFQLVCWVDNLNKQHFTCWVGAFRALGNLIIGTRWAWFSRRS